MKHTCQNGMIFINGYKEKKTELKADIDYDQAKIKKLYKKAHKNYNVLPKLFKNKLSKIKEIEKAFKGYDVKYKFSPNWYDNNTQISPQISFGVILGDIHSKYNDEWKQIKKDYRYPVLKSFVAKKMAEISKKNGIKVYGGESGYTSSGNRIFLNIQ